MKKNGKKEKGQNGSVTRYIYSAAGEKLRVTYLTAVPNITVPIGTARELAPSEILAADSTDYLLGGTLTMKNGRIDRYLFDEGYCQAVRSIFNPNQDGFTFYYYDRDHLGSVRQVIEAEGTDQGTIVQKMNYYPSGLQFCNNTTDSDKQSRRYNGKELDKMHGLNTYDYGARQYNPVTARWDRMDPLCEKYYSISPYAYCGNNPVNYVDSIGMSYDWVQNNLNGKIEWRDDVTSPDNTPNGYSYIGRSNNDILHHFGFTSNVLSQKETLWAFGREGTPSANVSQLKTTNITALLSLEAVTTIDNSTRTESNTSGLTFSGININGSFTQDNITSNPNYSFLYGGTLNAEIQGTTIYSSMHYRTGPSLNIPGNVTKEASIFLSQDLLRRGASIQNVKIDVGHPSTFMVIPHSFNFNIYR